MKSKGNAFNPDIGVNLLGLYQRGTELSDDRTVVPHNGFSLQEAEIQFTSDVDPYSRATALFSVHQEDGSEEYAIEPEEIYLESISLPWITLKAGKFKTAFGKHNQLHTHAFPFIDAPLVYQYLLGGEGLNEVGVSAAALIPVDWYSEVTLQALGASNEQLFASPQSGDIAGVIHLKNLWDLTDDLTFEFGISGTSGKNQYHLTSSAYGTDLTFKWRPSEKGKYHALIWSTEYLRGNRDGFVDSNTNETRKELGGVASWVQYQFAQRWWVQGRYEYVGLPRDPEYGLQDKQSYLIGFFPSEFSGFRFQYDKQYFGSRDHTDHTFSLQYNLSIGAHPAHAY
ncbi:MAG: hypothetical protein KDD22_08525 [Bdellovibrionales bacterium]|nr:hypothetical protein [Bdellovibrionales bacterium]